MPVHQVLLPLDGSDFSRRILDDVCRLLSPDRFELTLLRVAPVPHGIPVRPLRPLVLDSWLLGLKSPPEEEPPIFASQIWEGLRAELMSTLSPDLRRLREAGFAASAVVHFGDPAEEIIQYIESHPIELVVMATHGRSGIEKLLMGSVAEKVLRGLAVPIMMLRPVGKPGPVTEAMSVGEVNT